MFLTPHRKNILRPEYRCGRLTFLVNNEEKALDKKTVPGLKS
ncbi:Uncharacterized protein EbC_pEb17201090 (plasmid) [Erwinia billingiae Eb661]|uniref:Uncharacterized protein n=1 Tax=Erwinia billingiae (strain Eb661) TaxID=634500 RepID=D8MJW4_ERWBE|nr:Uncharacterized protein EbC_pEb17201090 [Erwinia billingiae Eb661]